MKLDVRKKQKRLHSPGFEPGTPAVLRQCHNQLDHERLVTVLSRSHLIIANSKFASVECFGQEIEPFSLTNAFPQLTMQNKLY